MKLRLFSPFIIFISAYSPLSMVFLLWDLNLDKMELNNPRIICSLLLVSLLSCLFVYVSVKLLKTSSPPIEVVSVSNRSGELVNYSIPYMISFLAMDLNNTNFLISFVFFMCIIYWLTLKTHNIFINPMLAAMGYNLYNVKYKKNDKKCEGLFLIKGERLSHGECCRIVEISEQLFLVTERNPEI